ncbi:HNH endonuclease [candidate division KSB1 bacterium]|nr:HNH endonuclease [candidate division KSB1 bacterium]
MTKLNRQVLVLNRSYEPLGLVSARKAVLLIFLGKVEIIENQPDMFIHSISAAYPLPSILRLLQFAKVHRRKIILSRKNIIKRDNGKCQYCGSSSKPLTVDHVIPKRRGGPDSWENLVCACVSCNNRKGDHTPEQAKMPLLKQPRKPNHVIFIHQNIVKMDERWKPYLFLS